MAELKQQDGKLFAYHSTGVSGLAYITMKADAGNFPLSSLPCPVYAVSRAAVLAWQALGFDASSRQQFLLTCKQAISVWTLLTCGTILAEGAGPVEIVTALAEDVQKAKQSKSRCGAPLCSLPIVTEPAPFCPPLHTNDVQGMSLVTPFPESKGSHWVQDVHTLHSCGGGVPCGSCRHQEDSKGPHRSALPSR